MRNRGAIRPEHQVRGLKAGQPIFLQRSRTARREDHQKRKRCSESILWSLPHQATAKGGTRLAAGLDPEAMVLLSTAGAVCAVGGLIHTAVGRAWPRQPAGSARDGRVRGRQHRAAARASPRRGRSGRRAGVSRPRPPWRCSLLYQGKKSPQWARACSMQPKRSGKSGRYFSVLNCASENGLSFETCGREWLFVTPRSASSSATGLDFIDAPRSAWMVSWPGSMPWRSQVSRDEPLGQRAPTRGEPASSRRRSG